MLESFWAIVIRDTVPSRVSFPKSAAVHLPLGSATFPMASQTGNSLVLFLLVLSLSSVQLA